MVAFLTSPRWLIATLVIVVLAVTFVSLGNWQLRRHHEVALENQVFGVRLGESPSAFGVLITSVGDSVGSLENRRATLRGTFDPTDEILVRSQVYNGVAGFHVVTPFEFDEGVLLVNRGWVPLAMEDPPLVSAPPPTGPVDLEVILKPSQTRPRFGPVEPEGRLTIVNRIDLDRLSQQFDHLAPVWGQLTSPVDSSLPVELDEPTVEDAGPHLGYAVQWYFFAATAVVGFAFLLRSASRQGV